MVELIRLANSWRGGDDPASGLDDLVADLSLCPQAEFMGSDGGRMRLQTYELSMHVLIKRDLEQIHRLHRGGIVLDNQQVRLLIVMCDTHDAGLSSDGVRDSGSPVMIH